MKLPGLPGYGTYNICAEQGHRQVVEIKRSTIVGS